jgi:hypothetical protein
MSYWEDVVNVVSHKPLLIVLRMIMPWYGLSSSCARQEEEARLPPSSVLLEEGNPGAIFPMLRNTGGDVIVKLPFAKVMYHSPAVPAPLLQYATLSFPK